MADREIYEVLFSMRSTKSKKGKEELHNSDIPGSTIFNFLSLINDNHFFMKIAKMADHYLRYQFIYFVFIEE